MAAAHHELGNLKLFVDCSGYRMMTFVRHKCECLTFAKWKSFGWAVKEIDGDMKSIVDAIDWMDTVNDKPAVVIANTVQRERYHSWKTTLHSTEQHPLMNNLLSLSELGVSA